MAHVRRSGPGFRRRATSRRGEHPTGFAQMGRPGLWLLVRRTQAPIHRADSTPPPRSHVTNQATRYSEVFGGRTGAFAEYVSVREDRPT
jgi:hypothetical protein